MKLFLQANFNTITGYGNSATFLAIELQKRNIDIYPICKSIGLDMPQEFLNLLAKKYPIGQYIDFYVNMDTPNNLEIPENLGFVKNKIAYTMWEQTRLTREYKNGCFDNYDNIFVPCSMNIEPFSKVFKENKIKIVPLGINTNFYIPIKRNFFEDTLKVCMNGALTFRKGIDILTDVMLDEQIKSLPIEFHLKNSQMTVHSKISEINPLVNVYQGVWTKEQIRDFYHNCHIMICPNRGEGFNQPALEFLATGGVVLTHNWGGHQNWVSSEYCKIVPHKLVNVTHWENVLRDSKWAEVSKEDIINALIGLYENRQELVTLSQNAIRISNVFNFENMADKFLMKLKGLKEC